MIDPNTILPRTNMTLQEAKDKLTAWHHMKEQLTSTEQEILYIAEGLLRLVDPESYGIRPDEIGPH